MQENVVNVAEPEKKKPTIKVQDALRMDGKFTYFDDISYEIHSSSRSISKTDFYDKSYKYKDEDEGIRMSYVLSAVHELGHANKHMILTWLAWKKKIFPDKLIPAAGTDKVVNERVISSMLANLCKNGLLMAHDYITQDKKVIVVYTCTYYGHIFYRNKLEMHTMYDMNSMFRTDIDTFKRLAADSMALAFSKSDRCTSVTVNGKYGRNGGSTDIDTDGYVYAMAEIDGNTAEPHIFIIEPFFFKYNKKLMTGEECEKKNLERLHLVEKIISQVKSAKDCDVRMVYVVENTQGLKKLSSLAVENSSSPIFQDALYTSENVLYVLDGDIDRAFVKIAGLEDGKIRHKMAGTSWL